MRIGVLTTEFTPRGAEPLFERIASHGFKSVQLSFQSVTESDFTSDGVFEIPPAIAPTAVRKIGEAAAARGIAIPACSGTFNMAHPDSEVRAEGVRRMKGLAAAARELGADVITLCTGTRNTAHMWSYNPASHTEDAWRDMTETLLRALAIAETAGLTLAVETEYTNVVNTPERARRMLDEAGSPRLGIIMDCANLFHPGDASRANAAGVIERAFGLLGGSIALAHGKDIAESDGIKFCPTGEGIVDYGLFARLLAERGFDGDMILHGIKNEAKLAAGIAAIRRAFG